MNAPKIRHPYDRYSPSAPIERPLPEKNWLGMAALVAVLTFLLTVGWELQARVWDFRPSFNDTPDLWALHRDRVGVGSLVVVGASRALFDLDLPILEKGLGKSPIMLAMTGSSMRPLLDDLANDPSFRDGELIIDITLPLAFAPGGPPLSRPQEFIDYRRTRTLSQRSGHALARRLEANLAFLKQEDLTLVQLLKRIDLPSRDGAMLSPAEPPYFGPMALDRSYKMDSRVLEDQAFRERIQKIWLGLLNAAPPMDEKAAASIRDSVLAEISADIAALRARNVKMVFVLAPVTGDFLEFEKRATPRQLTWDRLLAETGVPGIHFEDHPELADFDCPEWSHLSAKDATIFTERLVPHLMTSLRQ